MKLRYWLPLLLLACAGVGGWQLMVWRNRPPEVPFARVTRETIESAVSTNGKVEPVEWAEARAGRSGAVTKILVQRGQRVDRGTPLVELDSAEARADLQAAQARIAQVRADLDVLSKGGRSTELAEIASALASARQELQSAQKDHDELARLQAKDAATRYQVTEAQERIDQA
ncbi:MAG: biotin/lipoyl-binding protein, partial [Bryobacteraceae bacterium]